MNSAFTLIKFKSNGTLGKGKNSTAKSGIPVKAEPVTKEIKTLDKATKSPKNQQTSSTMDMKTKLLLWLMKCTIWIYDLVTFPIYFLVQQPWKTWKANRTVWAKQIREDDPYSPCVRHVRNCINPLEGIETMDELFRMSVVRFGTKKCLGVREVLSEADEYFKNGKVFKKVRLGDYKWFSYVDIDQRIENLSKGVIELGLQPKKQIVIFAETRIEWMLICQVCFRINVPVATLYSTLGEEGIIHGINETEVTHIFTSQELLPKLKKIIEKTPAVTHIVYMENIRPVDTKGFPEKVSIVSFSNLENMGATCDPISKPDPPEPNDLAVIMYTSGSTGTPKGVMLTHKNMVTTTSGLLDCIGKLGPDEVYIGYLPLAHAYEISAECFFFVMGIPVGYSSPHTMTDKSTAIMPGCKGDATILKPTIMTAVPLMADRIRKGVMEATRKKSKFAQEFFQFSLQYKLFWHKKGFTTPILNRLVFKPIKEMVGGNVRIMACGGLFTLVTAFVEINTDKWQMGFFALTIVIVISLGITSAVLQAGVAGIASLLPGKYMHIMVLGQAFAGILASVFQALSLLGNCDSIRSALVYFFSADSVILLALIAYTAIQKSEFFMYHTHSLKDATTLKDVSEVNLISQVSISCVLKLIWPYALAVMLNFWVSIGIFPGLAVLAVPESQIHVVWNGKLYLPLTCFFLFNLSDFCGRAVGGWLPMPHSKRMHLLVLCGLRFILFPLIMLCNIHPRYHLPVVFSNDIYYISFMTLLGLTNGYFVAVAMVVGIKSVCPQLQERAGVVLSAFLGAGLMLGALTSLICIKIL